MDVQQRVLKFHVAKATLRWSTVFERIMTMKSDSALFIEDVQVDIILIFIVVIIIILSANLATKPRQRERNIARFIIQVSDTSLEEIFLTFAQRGAFAFIESNRSEEMPIMLSGATESVVGDPPQC